MVGGRSGTIAFQSPNGHVMRPVFLSLLLPPYHPTLCHSGGMVLFPKQYTRIALNYLFISFLPDQKNDRMMIMENIIVSVQAFFFTLKGNEDHFSGNYWEINLILSGVCAQPTVGAAYSQGGSLDCLCSCFGLCRNLICNYVFLYCYNGISKPPDVFLYSKLNTAC